MHTQTWFDIATTRLLLRPMCIQDAEQVYRYRNQPSVMQFQGWTPESTNEVADYAKQMQGFDLDQGGNWIQVVIELSDYNSQNDCKNQTSNIIGDVAFCVEKELKQQAELGIAIDEKFQGRGYATEAINGLVNFLFSRFNLHRIHVSIDPENSASRRLFSRCQFREEGILRKAVFFKGEWTDDVIMAILREEWQAQP